MSISSSQKFNGKRYRIKSKSSPVQNQKPIMMVDFYSSSAATLYGGGHYELVLSANNNTDTAYLDKYIKEDADRKETKTCYRVPYIAVERCLTFIKNNGLSKWNSLENFVSTDGEKLVCKFWDGNEYIRVSNEQMPENGIKILLSIRDIMHEYLKDEYLGDR